MPDRGDGHCGARIRARDKRHARALFLEIVAYDDTRLFIAPKPLISREVETAGTGRPWSTAASPADRGFRRTDVGGDQFANHVTPLIYVLMCLAGAIAHVRGGREKGDRWYREGRLLNKRNKDKASRRAKNSKSGKKLSYGPSKRQRAIAHRVSAAFYDSQVSYAEPASRATHLPAVFSLLDRGFIH
jgi:hypothetical protein